MLDAFGCWTKYEKWGHTQGRKFWCINFAMQTLHSKYWWKHCSTKKYKEKSLWERYSVLASFFCDEFFLFKDLSTRFGWPFNKVIFILKNRKLSPDFNTFLNKVCSVSDTINPKKSIEYLQFQTLCVIFGSLNFRWLKVWHRTPIMSYSLVRNLKNNSFCNLVWYQGISYLYLNFFIRVQVLNCQSYPLVN